MSHPGIMKQSQYDNAASGRAFDSAPSLGGQVHEQLDKLQFALDAQGDIIQSLLRRIEPITGSLEYPCATGDAKIGTCLVPVAARIQSQIERVLGGNADLDRILSNIQI